MSTESRESCICGSSTEVKNGWCAHCRNIGYELDDEAMAEAHRATEYERDNPEPPR